MIGNKSDTSRVVSESDVEDWRAKNGNLPYFETTATTGVKVEETFRSMADAQMKVQASSAGGFDMPMSLSGATGAVTISAAGD